MPTIPQQSEAGADMTRLAVVVASLGRRQILAALVDLLRGQTRPPDAICIVVSRPEDAPAVEEARPIDVIIAPIGSCAQRNAGIERVLPDADIVVFLDDDFVPAPDYIEQLVMFFEDHPSAAGATGLVVADGVTGPGLSMAEALAAISARAPISPENPETLEERVSLYGCNMAFRREAIETVRFDERLPLYGWLEDVDFSARARRFGPLYRTSRLIGAHLGVKGGRTSGVRFGYSQIMNPVYLRLKGTMGLHHAFDNVYRNFLSNHAKLFAPEPHIDRRGRIKGNWMAIADILRGRITPERISRL